MQEQQSPKSVLQNDLYRKMHLITLVTTPRDYGLMIILTCMLHSCNQITDRRYQYIEHTSPFKMAYMVSTVNVLILHKVTAT